MKRNKKDSKLNSKCNSMNKCNATTNSSRSDNSKSNNDIDCK